MSTPTVIALHAKGVLDVDTGEVIENASVCIEGDRISSVSADAVRRPTPTRSSSSPN